MIKVASSLGYMVLVCENAEGDLKEAREPHSPRTLQKIVLASNDVNDLKNTLRRVDYKTCFVSVEPLSTQVARWSAHDTRVDSLLLTSRNIDVFDKAQAGIMKYYSKPLEVGISTLLLEGDIGAKVYRRIRLYAFYKVPLIVSSVASAWYELVHPRSIVSLLTISYDLPREYAIQAITSTPYFIVNKKRVEDLGAR